MKFRSSFFIFCLVLTLWSCKDDEAKENEANIMGTWQSTNVILRGCEDSDNDTTIVVDCPGQDCIQYTFFKDSTGVRNFSRENILSTGSVFETGTFAVGESRINFCIENDGEEECMEMKYTVSNTMLVLMHADADLQCTREIKFLREEPE